MQRHKLLIISVGVSLALVIGFFGIPFIIKQGKKAEIERVHWEATQAEYQASSVAAEKKRDERKARIKEIVESSYKLIYLGNGDVFFVPLNLPGLPSKNLETISVIVEYMQYRHYSYYSIFQIEYSDTETTGLWFKSTK